MTPSEIADRLEVNEPLPICPYDRRSPEYYTTNDTDPCKFCGTKNEDGAPDLCRGADTRLFAQAAATIRELEARATIAESMVAEANCSLFGSHSFFGDDKMHLSQAIEALKLESGNRWRALKIATEALEGISKGNRGDFESGDHMAFDKLMCAAQALARIKEV